MLFCLHFSYLKNVGCELQLVCAEAGFFLILVDLSIDLQCRQQFH